jgi:hypothetical protein
MVHVLAARGRIDLRGFSDIAQPLPRYICLNDFVPQQANLDAILEDFAIYASRFVHEIFRLTGALCHEC